MAGPGEETESELEADPAGQTAIFGREVEMFIDEDPIGRYIVQRIQQDVQQAQHELLDVDPTQVEAIRKLQFKAAVALSVQRWFAEAIQNGRAAAAQLQMERDSGN